MAIEGDGFVLRPMTMADAASLATHANNFNVWVNLTNEMPHPYSLEDARWFINHIAPEKPAQKFGIEIEGEIAGVVGINMLNDVYSHTAALGYWLGESHWGKGYMSRIVAAFVAYVFDTFDVTRIASSAYGHNIGSIKVLEKSGFVHEGTLRQHAFKNGTFIDEVKYGLLRSEYKKSAD